MLGQDDLDRRARAMHADADALAAARRFAAIVTERFAPALEAHYRDLQTLPAYRDYVARFGPELIDLADRHFSTLFEEGFSEQYLRNSKALADAEARSSFDVRARIGQALILCEVLFAEAGRRHRFSGPAAARLCSRLLSLLMADLGNAVQIAQAEQQRGIVERNAALDMMITTFRGEVEQLAVARRRETAPVKPSRGGGRGHSHVVQCRRGILAFGSRVLPRGFPCRPEVSDRVTSDGQQVGHGCAVVFDRSGERLRPDRTS